MRRPPTIVVLFVALAATPATPVRAAPEAADEDRIVDRIEVAPDGRRGRIHTSPVSMHGTPVTFVFGQHRGCRTPALAPHVFRELVAATQGHRPVRVRSSATSGTERCMETISFLAPMP